MLDTRDSFEELLVQTSEHFNCRLEEVVSRDYTPSLRYLCSRINFMNSNDETVLRNIFVMDNSFWQKALYAYYGDSYPIVSDVFTSVAGRLLVSLHHKRFEVFTVDGSFNDCDDYHRWVLAVSRKTRVGYYIDCTYIQYFPSIMTSRIVIGPDGRTIEVRDFSGLQNSVARGVGFSKFPAPIIRVGSPESFQWRPLGFSALLIKKNIRRNKT